jgi:sulfane dehydrogenase subunit SoxC
MKGSKGVREKASEHKKRSAGLGRRSFLKLMGVGGVAAVLAPQASFSGKALAQIEAERPEDFFVKDWRPYQFRPGAPVLSSKWYDHTSYITPIERFFVRNRYPTPVFGAEAWRLTVRGNAIDNPFELSYDELLSLPSRHAPRYMECLGNGRTLFREQQGMTVSGGDWVLGAISMGEWDYVPISAILERAGVRDSAKQVLFWSGVDGHDTGRPMRLEDVTARSEEIGLAYGLNGMPLHPDHGGPVRLIVPGWGGAASIKWLTEIVIADHRFWTRMHTREEAYIGPDYEPEEWSEDDEFLFAEPEQIRGQTATWQVIKSALFLPYALERVDPPENYAMARGEVPGLAAGLHTMRGYAVSPYAVTRVEYRIDEGRWQQAEITHTSGRDYSWVHFAFDWEATHGAHLLETRATDRMGNAQVEEARFNELGINFNGIAKFRVQVG